MDIFTVLFMFHWFKYVQFHSGLNIFIDIQTSKTLIQMDINKMMTMEFIQ